MTDFSSARILVTRTDRLGDVLLATPVISRIREAYPNAKVSFLVQKAWMPVLQYDAVEVLEYRPDESVEVLADRLREKAFDAVVVLRDEAVVSKAVLKAGIPVRIGPYSSLRSFFYFNRGKFQKRSNCEMHEAEYNLALLTKIGIPFSGPAKDTNELPRSHIVTKPAAHTAVDAWLRQNNLSAKNFYCLHPGSSGSARYISTETMVHLVNLLLREGKAVVLTGGPHEGALLNEIAHQSENTSNQGVKKAILFGGDEQAHPLDELAELLRSASLVIAHGTGPLHLAAAVGTRTFAIFPPIYVLSEKRWGPLSSERLVWTPPEVDCPEKYRCAGIKCGYYDCMSRFDAEKISVALNDWPQ